MRGHEASRAPAHDECAGRGAFWGRSTEGAREHRSVRRGLKHREVVHREVVAPRLEHAGEVGRVIPPRKRSKTDDCFRDCQTSESIPA